MKKLIVTLSLVLMGLAAHAEKNVPAWACTMNFKGTQQGLQLILGQYKFEGHGSLTCIDPMGQHKTIPVKVEMMTAKLSPSISFGYLELYGQTAEVSLFANEPEDLMGNYLVAQGQAAVFGGVGLITAVKVDVPQVALRVSLQFAKGFGMNLGLAKMRITAE